MSVFLHPSSPDRGFGVDCVFISAGGDSNAATELAVGIARDRARVVDIGKTSSICRGTTTT